VDPNTGYVANPSVVCTTTDVEYLADGRKSFPSGHASISMTGAVFFGIYIYRCFRKSPSMGSIVPLILAVRSDYLVIVSDWFFLPPMTMHPSAGSLLLVSLGPQIFV